MIEHDEIVSRLGRIEGKVDLIVDRLEKNDTRLGEVEKKVWMGSGIAALVGVLWPFHIH